MYDRQPESGRSSLWSQLLFKAVAGPAAAAGAALEVLPINVQSWADWRRDNPDTTVLAPDPRLAERYSSDPYTSYFGSDTLRFPVQPLPSPARYPLKTPLVALGGPQGWTAFPFPALASFSGVPAGAPWAGLVGALSYQPGGRHRGGSARSTAPRHRRGLRVVLRLVRHPPGRHYLGRGPGPRHRLVA